MTALDSDKALRQRLHEVAARFSVREIARRTGNQASTVSRYLRTNRIPADFVARVARSCGVNAQWLLHGEGPLWQGDVAAQLGQRAASLLALVGAMQQVSHLKLGALAGRASASRLKELADTLQTYERLRDRLAEQSREPFESLLMAWGRTLERRDDATAVQWRQAAQAAAKLCPDDRLQQLFLRIEASHEYLLGDRSRALDLEVAAFTRLLGTRLDLDAPALAQGVRLAHALRSQARMQTARRLVRAVLALTPSADRKPAYDYAMLTLARLEQDLDRPQRARAILGRGPRDLQWQPAYKATGAVLEYLGGTAGLEAAVAACEADPKSLSQVLFYTLWETDADTVARIVRRFDQLRRPAETISPLAPLARLHLKALRGQRQGLLEELSQFFIATAPAKELPPENRFALEVTRTQFLRLAGFPVEARRALAVAEATRRQKRKGYSIDFNWRRMHWRNVLNLPTASGRSRLEKKAEAFAEYARARGLVA